MNIRRAGRKIWPKFQAKKCCSNMSRQLVAQLFEALEPCYSTCSTVMLKCKHLLLNTEKCKIKICKCCQHVSMLLHVEPHVSMLQHTEPHVSMLLHVEQHVANMLLNLLKRKNKLKHVSTCSLEAKH